MCLPVRAVVTYTEHLCECVFWKQSLSLHPLRTQAGFRELLQMTAEQKGREEGLLSLAVPDI